LNSGRDLYYEDVSLWTNQLVLDETVVTLTRLLNVPRHCVNISATSKGLVSGSVSFLDSAGRLVNCSSSENGNAIYWSFSYLKK
jgi:DNA topoisomerase VI subunit A